MLSTRIIECIPNFSEGQNASVISSIANEISSIKNVALLNIDPGYAANRTVITFAGEPESVIEAAFNAVKKATELINMKNHKGEHPRMGATDVCPLVPICGVTMQDTINYSKILAKRIGEELEIPVYCYEESATNELRKTLSNIRSGEYEGFNKKMNNPEWKPDYGPHIFNEKSGATVVGARQFLIAFNVNLNTNKSAIAKKIAEDIRNLRKENSELSKIKTIGWYIKDYDKAQVSFNLTNYTISPVHVAFEIVENLANKYGYSVTGSELIGLIPLPALLTSGKYFKQKYGISTINTDANLIQIAIKYLGLDEIQEFNPEKKIIEYCLKKVN